MIPVWLLDKRLWVALAVVATVAIGVSTVMLYGNARYNAGVAVERSVWEAKLRTAVQEAREQEQQLAIENQRLAAEAHERDLARVRMSARVVTEIENAPDFETRYSAYLAHRDSLRDARAERLDRARADYVSTIVIDEPVEP